MRYLYTISGHYYFRTNMDDVKESLVDEITGHEREGETRGRYSKYDLKIKLKAISKVDYDLDFSRVKYPFP